MAKAKNDQPLTMVIDGNNMAHRAHHTMDLSYKGKDVSVTFGMLKMIMTLMTKFKPTSIIVMWDGGIPEFRRRAVPEYKANRHISDDPHEFEEMNRQMNELHTHVLPIMGIISIKKHKVEADDLMYHASRVIEGKVLIVTSDKDLLQAASENVSVYNPGRDTVYTPDVLEKEIGVSIENYVHWRAIQGDGSDNIAGVPGIGEKTATKLFQQFGSLSGIENAVLGRNPIGTISGRLGTSVISFGFDRITKNVYIMALFRDLTGSRKIIRETVLDYAPGSKLRLLNFLSRNGFISLLDTVPIVPTRLSAPMLRTDVRYPVVATERKAI